MYVCVYVCMYMCMYVYVCVYMYVCICMCVYVCIVDRHDLDRDRFYPQNSIFANFHLSTQAADIYECIHYNFVNFVIIL